MKKPKSQGKTQVYYHATPRENLTLILMQGIKPYWGGVYCSDNPDACLRWICFTKQHSKEIAVIPFDADPASMRLGLDHSPIMTQMILGVSDEGASWVSDNLISPDSIRFSEIRIHDNPCWNEHSVEQMKELNRLRKKSDEEKCIDNGGE
tara:strand:+ start:130 stop:579 length:450 start_codon:yes stop_codon:yes gene_type:complete